MRKYVVRRAGLEHADDIVAEVFTTAWRRRDDIPERVLPWLYGVAANQIAHAARTQEILLTAAASQVDLVAEPGQYWRHEVDGVWVVPREVQEPTGEFSGAVVADHQINFYPVSKDDPACFWIIAMNEPVAQLGAGFPIEGIDPITACQRANPEFPAPPRPERGPARSGRFPGVHGRSVRRHGAAPQRG